MKLARLSRISLDQTLASGLIILVAMMPFHAFLSVAIAHVIGHRELLQVWKELVIVLLGLGTVVLLIREPQRLRRLKWPILAVLGGFVAVALIVTAAAHPPASQILFGAKTDLEYLVVFALAILIADARLPRTLGLIVLIGAAAVSVFAILQSYVLPADFLTHFGYGPDTILPYQHITRGVNDLRFGSTLGGPNQLGTYLLLPLALSVAWAGTRRWWIGLLAIPITIAIIHTYSRSAWIGAAIAVAVVALGLIPKRFQRLTFLSMVMAGLLAVLALPYTISPDSPLQYYLLHSSAKVHAAAGSDFEHLASLRDGAKLVLAQPFGHGLGSAGPATFYGNETRIIENYYLQLAYETGILGLILFVVFIKLVAWELWQRAARDPLALACLAALTGISVVSLVLPAWTDSSTALIFWILTGAVMATSWREKHV